MERVSPMFPARDLKATIAFYHRLGFETAYDVDGYAILRRDAISLHIVEHGDHPGLAHNDSGCVIDVADPRALHDELGRAGALRLSPVDEKPGGWSSMSSTPTGTC